MAGSRIASISVGALILAALTLVFFADPATHSYYPPCLFHAITGLYCPGCGALTSPRLDKAEVFCYPSRDSLGTRQRRRRVTE